MSFNKKNGFTLAEVLVTMAIIGVVAALTTPAIVRNSQSAKIGPTVSRMKSTLEAAIQAMCNDQERYYFKDTINEETPSDLCITNRVKWLAKKYMKAKEFTKPEKTPALVDMKGASYSEKVKFDNMYMFSDKSVLQVPTCTFGSKEVTKPDGTKTTETTDYCEVWVFLGGSFTKHRVTLGRDFFPLMITQEGEVLTPEQVGKALGEGDVACTDENIDADKTTGYDCVNRVARDGWKANY